MGMSGLKTCSRAASFAMLWLLWPVMLWLLWPVGSGCSETTTPDSPVNPAVDNSIAFPNILDLKGVPTQAEDWSVFSMSDLGSWQSFGLSDETLLGGFSGPLGLLDGRWISPSFVRLSLRDVDAQHHLDFAEASDVELTSYPGRRPTR